jgi:hypothetical protein
MLFQNVLYPGDQISSYTQITLLPLLQPSQRHFNTATAAIVNEQYSHTPAVLTPCHVIVVVLIVSPKPSHNYRLQYRLQCVYTKRVRTNGTMRST